MAKLHGATLGIASELNAGTTVTIQFPPESVIGAATLQARAS